MIRLLCLDQHYIAVQIFRLFMVTARVISLGCVSIHFNIMFNCLIMVFSYQDADGMANSVNPDQTAPVGAV